MGQTVQLSIPKACHEDWHSITIQKASKWPWLRYFFQFTLPAFLISMKAQGQELVPDSTISVQVHPQTNKKQAISSDSAGSIIRGRVVDHEGVAFPWATIEINGSNEKIQMDKDGYFSFDWPKDKNVVLIISAVGFKTLRKKIKAKYRQGSMLLQLKMSEAVMGELVFCIR